MKDKLNSMYKGLENTIKIDLERIKFSDLLKYIEENKNRLLYFTSNSKSCIYYYDSELDATYRLSSNTVCTIFKNRSTSAEKDNYLPYVFRKSIRLDVHGNKNVQEH